MDKDGNEYVDSDWVTQFISDWVWYLLSLHITTAVLTVCAIINSDYDSAGNSYTRDTSKLNN